MAPVTDTDSIRARATPSTLIWVCGDASGVPLAGEIVSDAAPAGRRRQRDSEGTSERER